MRSIPSKGRIYLFTIILTGLILGGYSVLKIIQIPSTSEIITLVFLAVLASMALIFNVYGSTERTHYHLSFLIYSFTLLIFGLPEAGIIIIVSHLVEWPIGKYAWYVQAFNIGQFLISIQLAGLFYYFLNENLLDVTMVDVGVILSVIGALVIFTLANHFLVGMVIWLVQGESFNEAGIFDLFPLMLDFTLLSLGAVGAILWRENPFLILFVAIPLYLLFSTLRVPALERAQEIDSKTGLYNANFFASSLNAELARANRFNRPLTVVMADLDLLRNINNTYGHLAGDQVLIEVARILRENVREYDVLARFGGEEFSILMPETHHNNALRRVESIRKKFEEHDFIVDSSKSPIKVTISFGITSRTTEDHTVMDLIHEADIALYVAKLTGRNKSVVYGTAPFEQLIDNLAIEDQIPSLKSIEDRIGNLPAMPPAAPRQKPAAQGGKTRPISPISQNTKTTWQVGIFIFCLTLIAIGLLAITRPDSLDLPWIDMLLFSAMVALIEWFSIEIYVKETSVSTSAAPLLAGFILFGPVGVLLMGVTFALTAWLKHRGPSNRIFFNASNQIIPGVIISSAAGALFPLFVSPWQRAYQLLFFGLAAMILFLLTTFSISIGVYLGRKTSLGEFWQQQFSWLWSSFLGMGLVAFGIYVTYLAMGVLGALIFLVPLGILRLGQVQYVAQTKVVITELKNKNEDLRRSAGRIVQLNEELIGVFAEMTELNNPYLSGHSNRVAVISKALAIFLGLSEEQINLVHKSSLLHDIGKFGVDLETINKTDPLTEDEREAINAHVKFSVQVLSKVHSLADIIPIVHSHHERYDGTGYPQGLAGKEIPIEARIIALADAVDAMNSDRPYRTRLTHADILAEVNNHSGTQFDPQVVEAFNMIMIETEGKVLAR